MMSVRPHNPTSGVVCKQAGQATTKYSKGEVFTRAWCFQNPLLGQTNGQKTEDVT
ncbi:unnamed protein product, partial [Boreogadus saida]